MGRKPAKKKHRGIKDPYKQIEERFEKIKHKVDRKPVNDETQEISWRLKKISDFQEKKKKNSNNPEEKKLPAVNKKKKKKVRGAVALLDTARFVPKERDLPGMKRKLHMIPRLVQYSNEDDKSFLWRVTKASRAMVQESQFEDQYKVDVERNETGEVKKIKRRTALDDPALPDKVRVKLEERNKLRKEKKKERDYRRKHKNKKEDNVDEFSHFQDKVKFGEVVYEPPSLDTTKLKKLAKDKTKSFLFMQKMEGSQEEKNADVTVSRKRTLEEERLKAVNAYRELKASRYKTHNMALSFG